MPTKLQKPIRREIEIDGEPYTITIAPDGVRLTRKRFRSGVALSWKALWNEHVHEDPGERGTLSRSTGLP